VLTRHAITRRADADGVDAAIVERDYILAHVVAQLHRATPKDGGTLIFKGGTALRFIHIGDYRYSADLDFTLIGGDVGPAIAALGDVLEAARQHAALPFLELTDGDKPAISYVGPFGGAKPRHIKLDVAPDLPDALPFAVYSTEEIGAEKLRCIIQRVQCRDLYDLFRLTEDIGV
jgi:predicted nucleotidyltransferase component of viral defense system